MLRFFSICCESVIWQCWDVGRSGLVRGVRSVAPPAVAATVCLFGAAFSADHVRPSPAIHGERAPGFLSVRVHWLCVVSSGVPFVLLAREIEGQGPFLLPLVCCESVRFLLTWEWGFALSQRSGCGIRLVVVLAGSGVYYRLMRGLPEGYGPESLLQEFFSSAAKVAGGAEGSVLSFA